MVTKNDVATTAALPITQSRIRPIDDRMAVFFSLQVVAIDAARTILHARLSNCQGLGKTPRDPYRSPIDGFDRPKLPGFASFVGNFARSHLPVRT
jgi:hypothetical protein